MSWVANFLLLLFVAVSSGAIGWVLGQEGAECRRQWEPPCRHRTRRMCPCGDVDCEERP